jgi:hypothetical protein
VNNELERIWKETAMSDLRYHLGICLEGLRKRTKQFCQERQSFNEDLNSRFPEYEGGMLHTQP